MISDGIRILLSSTALISSMTKSEVYCPKQRYEYIKDIACLKSLWLTWPFQHHQLKVITEQLSSSALDTQSPNSCDKCHILGMVPSCVRNGLHSRVFLSSLEIWNFLFIVLAFLLQTCWLTTCLPGLGSEFLSLSLLQNIAFLLKH